ncbi:TetR family transcriptional regulator [Euzebya rosea]|uniref:TetR family transcriptional regulator n=1 Tax=Euzebya rosea TaxID=2052804 RepID=UPI001473AAAC|nr:TetR family transcriptional regulator [Euzebya rosea]
MQNPSHPAEMSATRAALLTRAEAMAQSLAWHEVTMSKLAESAGVSRQTVYNEFGNKQGLARAIALVVAQRLLQDFTEAAATEDDLHGALAAGLVSAFEHADETPLVHAVLTGQSGNGLLTVVTTDASEILETAGGAITHMLMARWPDHDRAAVAIVAELAIRLFVSHLLQPGPSRRVTATRIATIALAALDHGQELLDAADAGVR